MPRSYESTMARLRKVRDGVLGADAPRFEALLGQIDQGWGKCPLEAEAVYSQIFEIFRARHREYLEAPAGSYEHLTRWWKYYDPWPGVDEALSEAFDEYIYEDYWGCLDLLSEGYARDVADRKRELHDYREMLFGRAPANPSARWRMNWFWILGISLLIGMLVFNSLRSQ